MLAESMSTAEILGASIAGFMGILAIIGTTILLMNPRRRENGAGQAISKLAAEVEREKAKARTAKMVSIYSKIPTAAEIEARMKQNLVEQAALAKQLDDQSPDANCLTQPDGECVGGLMAGLPRCMHDQRGRFPKSWFPEVVVLKPGQRVDPNSLVVIGEGKIISGAEYNRSLEGADDTIR